MRTAICTLARREDEYINDWIEYHLRLGFDHLFIYDNGFINDKPLSSVIAGAYLDSVTVIDFRYLESPNPPNQDVYSNWCKNLYFGFDWCAFIDIDEFIVAEGYFNIKDFLDKIPQSYLGVVLNWHVFGDDGIVSGDLSIPVYQRFNKIIECDFNRYYKTILNCGLLKHNNDSIQALTPHTFGFNGDISRFCDSNFNTANIEYNKFKSLDSKQSCYINHYMTKTLSEFIKYKLPRFKTGSVVDTPFEYFFSINDRTTEKEAYIAEHVTC